MGNGYGWNRVWYGRVRDRRNGLGGEGNRVEGMEW